MSVKDAIATELISRLDANTFDEVFSVAIDLQQDGDRKQFFSYPEINQTTLVEFVPTSLDFTDTPRGIAGIDKTEWNIGVTFSLRALQDDDDDFKNQKDAIEEFRLSLINNSLFTVIDGATTYNCKSIATSLSRVGFVTTVEAGYTRLLMSMAVTIVSGIGISFGDDEIWELKNLAAANPYDFTVINPTTKQFGIIPTYKPAHQNGDEVSTQFIETAIYKGEFELDFDKTNLIHRDLYALSKGETSINTIYELRITRPYGGYVTYPNLATSRKIYLQIISPADLGISTVMRGFITDAKQ